MVEQLTADQQVIGSNPMVDYNGCMPNAHKASDGVNFVLPPCLLFGNCASLLENIAWVIHLVLLSLATS